VYLFYSMPMQLVLECLKSALPYAQLCQWFCCKVR
jgi:hypothetical protein